MGENLCRLPQFFGVMDKEAQILKLDTIQSLNDYLGVKSPNSLFTVIDLWEVGDVKQVAKRYNLYCVILVRDDERINGTMLTSILFAQDSIAVLARALCQGSRVGYCASTPTSCRARCW